MLSRPPEKNPLSSSPSASDETFNNKLEAKNRNGVFPPVKFNPIMPEFYVSDFQKSINFYTKVLRFRIEYQRPSENPRFAFLSYGGCQLMLQLEDDDEDWHNGKAEYPFGRGINFQIETNEVQRLIDNLINIQHPLKRGLKDSWYQVKGTVYGCREFLVMDPDGYLLRFSQPLWSLLSKDVLHLHDHLELSASSFLPPKINYLIASYVHSLPDLDKMPDQQKENPQRTLHALYQAKVSQEQVVTALVKNSFINSHDLQHAPKEKNMSSEEEQHNHLRSRL